MSRDMQLRIPRLLDPIQPDSQGELRFDDPRERKKKRGSVPDARGRSLCRRMMEEVARVPDPLKEEK